MKRNTGHRHRDGELREAQGPDVLHQVGQAQGFGDAGQGLEELAHRSGGEPQLLRPLGGQPGGQEVLHPAPVVQQGHHPVAGGGQGAGRVQDALEHRVEVQALVDAPAGLADKEA